MLKKNFVLIFMVVALCISTMAACTVPEVVDDTSTPVSSEENTSETETEAIPVAKDLSTLSGDLTAGPIELQLPEKYKNIYKRGLLSLEDGDLEHGDMKIPAYSYYVPEVNLNNEYFNIVAVNNTDEEYPLDECIVLSCVYNLSANSTFSYEGLNQNSTEADVKAVFGDEPYEYYKSGSSVKMLYKADDNSTVEFLFNNGKLMAISLNLSDALTNNYYNYSIYVKEEAPKDVIYTSVRNFFELNNQEYNTLLRAAEEQNVTLTIEDNDLIFNYTYSNDEFNDISVDEARDLLQTYMEENREGIEANINEFADVTLNALLANSNIDTYKIIWNYSYKEEVIYTIEVEKLIDRTVPDENSTDETVEDAEQVDVEAEPQEPVENEPAEAPVEETDVPSSEG